jgi:hypothetical protein
MMINAGEPTPTIAELISFIRACEDQIGTEGYSRPRLRAVLAILEASQCGAAMIEEPLTEAERRKLLDLVMAAVPREHGDQLLTGLIAKLSGTDTVIVARRAYPSRKPEPPPMRSERKSTSGR